LLFRVAHSVLRSREEAEDVVQDVFVRVLKHRRSLTAVRDMRVWLVRVAWNLAAPGCRGGDGTDCSIGVTGDPIGPGPSASPAALPKIEHALPVGWLWIRTYISGEEIICKARVSIISSIIWPLRSDPQMPLDSSSLCRYL
jgi:hypothetical protein